MDVLNCDPEALAKAEVLAGGGDMGALMRSHDWSSSPLGPVEKWPQSLRTSVSTCLNSRFAILVWWGPQLVMLYNDSYAPIIGTKHPKALGCPGREVWPEIWEIIGPMLNGVLERGEATWADDLLLLLHRNGYQEECYFAFSYSPIRDESGGIGGIFTPVFETTDRVIGERRLRTSRDLADARAASSSSSVEEACKTAIRILSQNSQDLPFAAIYLFDKSEASAILISSTGAESGTTLLPYRLSQSESDPSWIPLASIARGETCDIDLQGFVLDGLPTEPWGVAPVEAIAVPMLQRGKDFPTGFLLSGVNPRKRLSEEFRPFYRIVADQIVNTIREVEAFEQERKRAEALAEIDRAKTAFFTNISHEFRTPITLLLGPLEDTIADPGLPEQAQQNLRLAHRNSLRLLKLVNTLLDFSRIEAGRIQAVYEPVDLATFTAELAGLFRSAIERAGIEMIIDCHPLDQPVYVDREMWEKIVLNLLSNAFKFTLKGQISVILKAAGEAVEFIVRDSGCGITPEELPRIFERFYRAKGAPGRSYEGSGIGLALIQELVKLHGGTVRVETETGVGSAFTVSMPLGFAHLPVDRVGAARTVDSTATDAVAYVEEARRWLPDGEGVSDGQEIAATLAVGAAYKVPKDSGARARILLADDNADIREYVRSLLASRYDIETVNDGEGALQAALQRTPDLILSDVMMPKLDGFGMLQALRADERTATIPVILLSARAGEEARVEGIAARADDYIVKPFAARELVARVETNLALSRLRRETEQALRESEERFRALVTASADVVYRMSPDWSEMRQLHGRDFVADTDTPSRTWLQRYIHPDDQARVLEAINEAIRTKTMFDLEHRVVRVDGSLGWTCSRAVPLLNANGEIVEWFGTATDVTERKRTEEALLRSEKLASVNRMAASMAHEINNPLEAVTNTLYLARTNADDPGFVRQYLDMAEDELKRISHITRQTLGFYRESSAPTVVRVTSIMDSAVDLLQRKIDARGVSIEKQYDSDLHIVAVAGELRQVFSNLLVNSLEAIEKRGTIKLRVTKSTCVNTSRPRIRVTVADDGKGIDPATMPRIFDPLFTTKEATGSGLGLWVSKQIIEKHGGSIRVRSRSGTSHSSSNGALRGTAFTVLLPVEAPARTAQ